MKSTIGIFVVAMLAAFAIKAAHSMPQCNLGNLEEIDNPKIREICTFLRNYADAVQHDDYSQSGGLDDLLGQMIQKEELFHFWEEINGNVAWQLSSRDNKNRIGRANNPLSLIDGGVKRQDVDHVFLRFGRRR